MKMKFILYKEKIATPDIDLMSYKNPYDRHYYLDSFEKSPTFQEVLKVEGNLVKEMDIQVLDLEQTFLVMGSEHLNPDDFEFAGESENGASIYIRRTDTGEEFTIPAAYVRTKAKKRKVIATRVITPYRGQFKDNSQENWVDFALKYKVKITSERLIQMFIYNHIMLEDFNNLLPKENQIIPVRIDKGFLFNLYLEKIDFKSIT